MDDLSGAINAAIESAKTETSEPEVKAAEPEAPEAPAETEAAEEPEAPAEEEAEEPAAKEAEVEDDVDLLNPTAAELAVIEANPELKKVYKSLQRGLTKKSTEFKTKQKELQARADVADWIQRDPDAAAAAIAAARGYKLTKEEKAAVENLEAVDALEKEYAETIGPDAAKLLRPLTEKTVQKAIDNLTKTVIEPLKAQAAQVEKAAQERGIAAAVSGFESKIRAEGGEWDDDLQADMAARINRLKPSDDIGIDEYLTDIYDGAMAARMRLKAAKSTRDRLRRISKETEPVTPARAAVPKEERVTSDMKDRDAIAMAVKIAKQESARAR